ncbi:MAG: hypothetical protein A3H96_18845 [Acidobacteria bacterium RIFCSPLOWO2_02_FULL_67_36]|nr:MAG: hypothetical protein A3H96_18845 [Acidobacteria bacterium RIFCSPLOWO2_02_FULL_67_36]OFW18913.1 MAG: hypothetical protein A3G21_04165 [Acidobacteria bacterium RIFCSPLOWO2_12_FULL_66_21]
MFPSRARTISTAFLLAIGLAACGGSSGSSNSPTPPTTQNPCAATFATAEADVPASPQATEDKRRAIDGNPRWRVLDALWLHRAQGRDRQPTLMPRPQLADVGDVAIVQDEGDLVLPPNTFDLKTAGLRFTRNGSGGYDVRKIDATFRQTLGSPVPLSDDDSAPRNVQFAFSFYGRTQTAAFVNSDGNITFEEEDKASTERNVARLLTGPPRVAPFLADLDPSIGAGKIFVNAASDQYTVTWCSVRGFDSAANVTAQVTLLPDGTIEMKYETVALGDAVVGLSPGHTGEFKPVNLSDTGPTGGGGSAVGERFAASPQLDTVALAQKFYRSHSDSYDQLILWTDTSVTTSGTFAYELTVANEVRGIGIDIFDASEDFGSTGRRLRSLVVMDALNKYPDDPAAKFLGENNTLSLLGQESGHRWLAFLEFKDHDGQRSDALLGRDLVHWSFFMNSDASVMEGNAIQDLGGGSFVTTAAVQRYSLLDQYAMGLVPDTEVPTFFYVESPVNVTPSRTRSSAPQVGVTFSGTRRDVLIKDVTDVMGPRIPSAADSPRTHRQAFIYLVSAGRSADTGLIAKIDRIRKAWEPFFMQATDQRMTLITRLQ